MNGGKVRQSLMISLRSFIFTSLKCSQTPKVYINYRTLLRGTGKMEILQSCSEGFSVLVTEKCHCGEGGSSRDSHSEGTVLPRSALGSFRSEKPQRNTN